VENLSVSYGRRRVLDGVCLSVPPGALVAVVGPNGAGKSSLLKATIGLVHRGGQVWLDGQELEGGANELEGLGIGYLPQDTSIRSALTVLEVVLLGRLGRLGWRLPARALEAAVESLDALGLAALASRPVAELSGGQRQLVFLAQALTRQPRLLLLDEPTSALDLKHQLTVLSILRGLATPGGTSVLTVMHDINLAVRFADRLVVLRNGGVHASGSPAEVVDTGLLRDVFEVEAELTATASASPVVVPIRALAGAVPARQPRERP
jgi:iron complex transport system ATP-binding protein